MNRSRLILLLITICVAISYVSGQVPEGQSTQDSSAWQTTDWGQMCRGLQIRVNTATSVVSEEMLELNLEFRITPDSLGPHVKDIVLLPPGTRATLHVYNEVTGKQTQHVWKQRDLAGLAPARFDAAGASDTASLSSKIETQTPLVIVESPVQCRLELFVPMLDSSVWSGFVASPVFDLTLTPRHTELETLTVVFPRECRLMPGPRIGFDSLNMDSMKVEHHKGLCLGRELGSPRYRELSGWGILCGEIVTNRDFPLPWGIVFEDGYMNTSYKFTFFETTRCPEHMWSPRGPGFRVLWEREYMLTLSKDEMDSMTIPEYEQYSYHTFVVPSRIKVSGENHVIADRWVPTPVECKINRGWEVGYWVTIDGKYTEPFYHPMRSPFYQLRRRPTCESPIKFGIYLIQYQRDKLRSDKPNYPGTGQILWSGHALLSDTSTSVDMEPYEDLRLPRPTYWRQCLLPRRLEMDENGQIVADMSDPITVDFRQDDGQLALVGIRIGADSVQFLPTYLPRILGTVGGTTSRESNLACYLSVHVVADSCLPTGKERPIWSRQFRLEIPDGPDDTLTGAAE